MWTANVPFVVNVIDAGYLQSNELYPLVIEVIFSCVIT